MREIEQLPKYQAFGLSLGILSVSDIQAWVDARIKETESPSEQLIDLAFSKDKKGYDLHSVLLSIDNAGDKYEIVRALLAKVNDSDLSQLKYCRNLAKLLEHFAIDCNYDVPDDLNAIYGFDDEYNLAEQGIYSSLESWYEDFKNFVIGFRENY